MFKIPSYISARTETLLAVHEVLGRRGNSIPPSAKLEPCYRAAVGDDAILSPDPLLNCLSANPLVCGATIPLHAMSSEELSSVMIEQWISAWGELDEFLANASQKSDVPRALEWLDKAGDKLVSSFQHI